MTVCGRRHRVHAWAAVLLLLFQCLLPSLHRLEHALADGGRLESSAALCRNHDENRLPASGAADEHADACSLCVQLMQVRDLLPEPPAPVVMAVVLPEPLPVHACARWLAPLLPLPPPARGPPLS